MSTLTTPEGGPNGLPALPDYSARPEPPASLAVLHDEGLAQLHADIGGDGLLLATAARRNGYSRAQVGNLWLAKRAGTEPTRISEEAYRHFNEHMDPSSAGVQVPRAERGQCALEYGRYVLQHVLRRPRRPEDTDVRLRTRYDYYIPGTRFDDPFPADNVQVTFGLLADGQVRDALETIANIEHDTMRFGYAPNFSRIAMLREQTAVDGFAIEAVLGLYGTQGLLHWRDALIRNIRFKQEGKERLAHLQPGQYGAYRRIGRLPNGRYAYRHWDDTPVDYRRRTVIRTESVKKEWALLDRIMARTRDEDERAHLWVVKNKDLGAAAESFQDMSDAFLEDRNSLESIRTTEIYTCWNQAAVAQKLRLVAHASEAAGDWRTAEKAWHQFHALRRLVNEDMMLQTDENHGYLTDLNLDGTQTGALNAAAMMPLLVGDNFVTYENARLTLNTFRSKLLGKYGLHTSDIEGCPEQWSGKRIWFALCSFAKLACMEQARAAAQRTIAGQPAEPFIEFAEELDAAMVAGADAWFDEHGTYPERIDGENPREVALGGEYCSIEEDGKRPEPQVGFGMTIGPYIVARVMNVRELFSNMDPSRGSWLSQSFAMQLGHTALQWSGSVERFWR